MNIEGLDKTDLQILETIKDNARMSYSEIGSAVGISRVSVRNRMEEMEKAGVIQGYKTIVDPTMPEVLYRYGGPSRAVRGDSGASGGK